MHTTNVSDFQQLCLLFLCKKKLASIQQRSIFEKKNVFVRCTLYHMSRLVLFSPLNKSEHFVFWLWIISPLKKKRRKTLFYRLFFNQALFYLLLCIFCIYVEEIICTFCNRQNMLIVFSI